MALAPRTIQNMPDCLQREPITVASPCETEYMRGKMLLAVMLMISAQLANADSHKGVVGTFHGILKHVTKQEIVIQSNEDQTVSIRRSGKTKFFKDGREIKPSEIARETPVSIDAIEDIDWKPLAIGVTVDSQPKKAAEK